MMAEEAERATEEERKGKRGREKGEGRARGGRCWRARRLARAARVHLCSPVLALASPRLFGHRVRPGAIPALARAHAPGTAFILPVFVIIKKTLVLTGEAVFHELNGFASECPTSKAR